jgi:hypothetical protein
MNEDLTWCCIDSRGRASNLERRSEIDAASGACLKEEIGSVFCGRRRHMKCIRLTQVRQPSREIPSWKVRGDSLGMQLIAVD